MEKLATLHTVIFHIWVSEIMENRTDWKKGEECMSHDMQYIDIDHSAETQANFMKHAINLSTSSYTCM